ncbi:hypothetical protein [Rhizobium aethiopicum]|uniref:hypothetical protein n=1 Tax=Rhizobium aethiopicum TaxID=1138170 RepID=UPI003CC9583A
MAASLSSPSGWSVSMMAECLSTKRACFRAGYTAGKQLCGRRFVLRAGRLRITVWATGVMEARKKAEAYADFRAARNGWPKPKMGWQFREVK